MAEFDEKLNSILSNPDAMSQIMQLAQSLGGGGQSAPPPGQTAGQAPAWSPPPPQQAAPPPPGGGGDLLSSLLGGGGGLDPGLLSRLVPLIQELGGDSNARNLLYALRPYLRQDRQEKVERALQLARLFRLGKKFLSGWEG